MAEFGSSDTFFEGESARRFIDYEQQSVRGYLRYEIVHRNLEPYILGRHFDVVDVGGGTGRDAQWLAELGHTVVLAEPSSDHRSAARQRIAKLPTDIQDRVDIVDAETTDLLKQNQRYDLVLSHGVAMYLPDPAKFVADLGRLAKTGGHISFLEKGFEGKDRELRHEYQGEEGGNVPLRQLHATGWTDSNHAQMRSYAFKPEELTDLLSNHAKAKILEWSGVRMGQYDSDLKIDDMPASMLKITLDAEYAEGHVEAEKHLGQMLHFIAEKS